MHVGFSMLIISYAIHVSSDVIFYPLTAKRDDRMWEWAIESSLHSAYAAKNMERARLTWSRKACIV